MSFQVTPKDLEAAADAVKKAAGHLADIAKQGKAAQTDATEIHYEPAAGKADAVGQKAASNLKIAHDVLDALETGFRAAAKNYGDHDHNAMPHGHH